MNDAVLEFKIHPMLVELHVRDNPTDTPWADGLNQPFQTNVQTSACWIHSIILKQIKHVNNPIYEYKIVILGHGWLFQGGQFLVENETKMEWCRFMPHLCTFLGQTGPSKRRGQWGEINDETCPAVDSNQWPSG